MISAKQYFKEAPKFGVPFHPDFVKEYTQNTNECGFLKPVQFRGLTWPGGYLYYSIQQRSKHNFELLLSNEFRKLFTSVQQCRAYLSYFEQWGDAHTIESDFTKD